jgi:signal transduction histidine kinase
MTAGYGFLLTPSGIPRSQISDFLLYGPISAFGQIFTLALFVGALKFATYTSNVLAEERMALKLIQDNLRVELEASRSELESQFENAISPLLKMIESDLKRSQNNDETVKNIHSVIDDVVRPLSHDLDHQGDLLTIVEFDRSKVARQIRHTSSRYKLIRPAPVALSVSPLAALTLYVVFDITALIYLFDSFALISVGIPFLIFAALGFYMHLKVSGTRTAKAIVVFGISAVEATVLGATFTALGMRAGYEAELIAPIGLSVFLITVGASWFELALDRTRESRRKAEQVNIEIASSISAVRQKLWYLRKKVARELHGGLQAKLQALALQIDMNQGVESESLTDFYEQMKRTIESDPYELSVQPFIEYANDFSEFWTGIADVKFSLNDVVSNSISSNIVLNECLREIIREAINNAIKHAGANSIEISLNLVSESQVQLTVTNNVVKPSSANSTRSLGTKIFEELSDSWNMSVGPEKSTLTAIFTTISHIN